MKRQEILDAVTLHAKKMNMQSANNGRCVYRGTNGKMCLIGALIKDEFYSKYLDAAQKSAVAPEIISALQKSGVLSRGKISDSTKDFLDALQRAHDSVACHLTHSSFRQALKENLQNVAYNYKLKLNW